MTLQVMSCNNNYQKERSKKKKKKISLKKDDLGGEIMRKSVELRAKSYSYLIDDGSKGKNA